MKREIHKKITNLTTTAAIRFTEPIGLAIGFEFYATLLFILS